MRFGAKQRGWDVKLLWFNLRVDRNRPSLAFAIDWLNAVAEQVDQIDVITMYVGEFQVRENVRIYSVGKEKGYSEPRRAIEFYRILARLLSHQHYDACFAHMMPLFAVMATPFLRIKEIPVILWYAHKSVTPILRLATLLVDRILTSTKEGFRIKSHKIRILGQGIDTERFVPKTHEDFSYRPFTILTVGRLSQIKRIDLLIEAVALIRQTHPHLPICLKIVGGALTVKDQTYASELRRQVEQYQLQNTVIFMGNIPFTDIISSYQQADCFVNLCPTGAIDKVVLEAMSCGVVPVVANRSFSEVFGSELRKICMIEATAKQLQERLLLVAFMPESERRRLGSQLRAIVVRGHALQKLCAHIVYELRELSGKGQIVGISSS